MKTLLPISHLGDQRLWREDVAWLADSLAQRTLVDVAERVRWLHVHLQPLGPEGTSTVARVQVDVAGRDLISIAVVERCAQAALCSAFRAVSQQASEHEPIAI
jgi:hypothetical protein